MEKNAHTPSNKHLGARTRQLGGAIPIASALAQRGIKNEVVIRCVRRRLRSDDYGEVALANLILLGEITEQDVRMVPALDWRRSTLLSACKKAWDKIPESVRDEIALLSQTGDQLVESV